MSRAIESLTKVQNNQSNIWLMCQEGNDDMQQMNERSCGNNTCLDQSGCNGHGRIVVDIFQDVTKRPDMTCLFIYYY